MAPSLNSEGVRSDVIFLSAIRRRIRREKAIRRKNRRRLGVFWFLSSDFKLSLLLLQASRWFLHGVWGILDNNLEPSLQVNRLPRLNPVKHRALWPPPRTSLTLLSCSKLALAQSSKAWDQWRTRLGMHIKPAVSIIY